MSNKTSLPIIRFMRLKSILAPVGPIPVSKSTWWAGVKIGRFPKPHKLGTRITAWTEEDIRTLSDVLAGRLPAPSDWEVKSPSDTGEGRR